MRILGLTLWVTREEGDEFVFIECLGGRLDIERDVLEQ